MGISDILKNVEFNNKGLPPEIEKAETARPFFSTGLVGYSIFVSALATNPGS